MLQQVSNISPIHRLNQSGKSEFHSLVTQYRSNATLVEWPNEVFYNGQIKTDESVANLRLSDLLETQSIESSDPVYDLFENTDENKSNEVEKVKTASTNDELSLVNNLLKQQIVFVDLDQVI
jgi:superfamily I DNA and/or RNA helicase